MVLVVVVVSFTNTLLYVYSGSSAQLSCLMSWLLVSHLTTACSVGLVSFANTGTQNKFKILYYFRYSGYFMA